MGKHAITVRNTIIRLAWSLKIHKDNITAIEEYTNPKKNISHGLFSAFNGLSKDSNTISCSEDALFIYFCKYMRNQ
jgi:hypothetical protein